jgi:serine phosphatase RsbU (regulator of sigma subunit)
MLSRISGQWLLAGAAHLSAVVPPICATPAPFVLSAGNQDRRVELEGLAPGIAPRVESAQSVFHLAPGESLTFPIDGVVETRNSSRELFGFERAEATSTQPAEEIARAAQQFGQEDDITVLTLQFAGAEVRLA